MKPTGLSSWSFVVWLAVVFVCDRCKAGLSDAVAQWNQSTAGWYIAIAGDSTHAGYRSPGGFSPVPDGGFGGDVRYNVASNLWSKSGGILIATNWSRSGSTWTQQGTNWLPAILLKQPRFVVLKAGVNDVATGVTWAKVLTNLNYIRAQITASNALMVLTDIAPCSSCDDTEAETIRTWNTNYTTWAATSGVYRIADWSLYGTNRPSTGFADDIIPAWTSDGTHLEYQAYDIMGSAYWTNFQTFRSNTWHVSTSGDDTEPGTAARPFRTIAKAVAIADEGDSILISDGFYGEAVSPKRGGSSDGLLRVIGQSTNAITGGFVWTNGWWELSQLRFTGTNRSALAGIVYLNSGSHNTVIRSNHFAVPYRESPASSNQYLLQFAVVTNSLVADNFFGDTEQVALQLFGSDHVVSNNTFSSVFDGVAAAGDRDAIRLQSSRTIVTRNTVTNWTSIGGGSGHPDIIQLLSSGGGYVATNNTIERNLFIDCYGATQIGNLGDDSGEGTVGDWTWRNNVWSRVALVMGIWARDMKFYNNVFYRSGTNSGSPVYHGYDAGGNGTNGYGGRWTNNIFVECSSLPDSPDYGWYYCNPAYTNNFSADYNLVIGTGAGTTKNTAYWNQLGREAHGINGQDPLFVGVPNFRLQSASPAVGAGTDLSAFFTDDFTGSTRVAPWDIGAYEYFAPGGITATAGTVNVGTLNIAP